MIPLYKLDKLPRTQKLRKIAKFFTFVENRIAAQHNVNIFTASEICFFKDAARLLAEDGLFQPEARNVFNDAVFVFEQAASYNNCDISRFRRALNSVKHILLSETSRDQADWDFTCAGGCLDPLKRRVFEGMFVYLEDIRSPFNVGAMFRTAESFGVEKIILSPFCADPRHRRAERTAMGCVDSVPWERQELFTASSATLPYPVFALETGGISISEFPFPRSGLLIAGSEELGVSPHALDAADASLGRVSIPSYGAKASLNVSVAFGIALHIWGNKLMLSEEL
ncbi:MAG: TrmH family RNA methyltransferase [Treponema sp.]|nr:TrmH family RNA methyltransferase [Treponema sp.]